MSIELLNDPLPKPWLNPLVNNETVQGNLIVNGTTTLNSLALGSLSVTGNATIGGTLGVTGLTTLGNETVGGTLGVTGLSTLSNASITGTLGVTGLSTLANTTITGTLTVPNQGSAVNLTATASFGSYTQPSTFSRVGNIVTVSITASATSRQCLVNDNLIFNNVPALFQPSTAKGTVISILYGATQTLVSIIASTNFLIIGKDLTGAQFTAGDFVTFPTTLGSMTFSYQI